MVTQDNSSRSPEEIRRDIEETRRRMGKSIDAVEQRLNPDRLKQEASDAIREQTIGRVERFADEAKQNMKGAGDDVLRTIKANPIPAALAAIGLGWLLMESRNENQNREPDRYMRPRGRTQRFDSYEPYDTGYARQGYDARTPYEYGTGHDVKDRMQQAKGDVQDKAHQMVDSAQDMAGQVTDKAQDMAGQVTDKAHEVAGQVQDKAQEVAGQVQDQAENFAGAAQAQAWRARNLLSDLMDEKPLLIGAAAVALGAAIGMSLPSTSQEDAFFGSQRDDLMESAKTKAEETMQKAQNVAEKAGETVTEEAKKQGLMTGQTTGQPTGQTASQTTGGNTGRTG